MRHTYCSIPERPRDEQERVNDQARAALREIGAVFPPKIWATGMPIINLSDLTLADGEPLDLAPFRGRLVLGPDVGFYANSTNPFPHGSVRLTMVRWGKGPEEAGRIECHSMLNATSIVSYCGVYVGKGVLFGPNAIIMDSDGHVVDRTLPDIPEHKKMAPVRIEDHAWIGYGALIMKGVTVGHHAVVAAQAVVTKDVPPHCVVAGNPARVVKDFTEQLRARGA